MSTVLLDSVGILALWNNSDQWHAAAQRAYDELRQTRADFVTTRYILLECGNTVARTALRAEVTNLRMLLGASNQLIDPTDEDWTNAWAAYDRGDAGDAGIVDHVSFVIMRRLGISQAFTNDRHFAAAGFETLF